MTKHDDYPISYQAVDIVIINKSLNMLLLGKKPSQSKFRFIGGFVDPSDKSLEDAANRERIEESGVNLECTIPQYLFSFRVDDPRYRDSKHKIMSAVFLTEYLFGYAIAGDDIGEVGWYSFNYIKEYYNKDFDSGLIVAEHHPLVEKLIQLGVI